MLHTYNMNPSFLLFLFRVAIVSDTSITASRHQSDPVAIRFPSAHQNSVLLDPRIFSSPRLIRIKGEVNSLSCTTHYPFLPALHRRFNGCHLILSFPCHGAKSAFYLNYSMRSLGHAGSFFQFLPCLIKHQLLFYSVYKKYRLLKSSYRYHINTLNIVTVTLLQVGLSLSNKSGLGITTATPCRPKHFSGRVPECT